ncbi:phosphoglycerate mutase-like protein, partial [Acephala macrosclerotiorum]
MAVLSTIKLVGVVALVGSLSVGGVGATTFLAPEQDIVLPVSETASEPLEWLGANSPYFAGPNINGISNSVPEGCTVEQVAYNVRHGSRYPDSGAYAQWTTLYAKIQAANFTATGSMAFLKDWEPVLTNPTLQMSQESPTGFKEAYDLGYTLRTRYPKLYSYGTPFISWANLYPRVVQAAQNFVRGFLGSTASSLGQVITINSTGSEQALFDSLSPSDLCPKFVDGNGGTEQTTWNSIYLPPILTRLEALIDGNLTFTTTDVSIMPYLCGFESQITGTLSPWCSVFTDEELKQYEYAQDLRYYYGMGPGEDLPSKMMLPYLNSLVGLLSQGPGVNGTYANGTSYILPNIITAFMNDGQITELGAATGVWDTTISLGNGTSIPDGYTYISSHFVTMRGTVAFERLNCVASSASKAKRDEEDKVVTVAEKKTITLCTETESLTSLAETTKKPEMTTSTILKTSVYTITSCPPTVKNCPIGEKTSTVYTSTTVCPVEEASSTSTAAGEWTTSTIVETSSYVVTSCKHNDKHCRVGETTSTVYTTTTVCPVDATTTSAAGSWTTSTHLSTSTGKYGTSVITLKTSYTVSASATATATGSSSSFLTKTSSGSGSGSSSTSGSGSASGSGSTSGSSSGSASVTASASYTSSGSGSGYSNSTTSSSTLTSSSSYLNATTTSDYSNSTASSTSSTATSTSTPTSGNSTYIRILLNDAVYPVPSCQDGPGSSCLMSEYVALIKAKVEAAGDLVTRCNVTNAGAPTTVKGASFFTDLSDSWLASVV